MAGSKVFADQTRDREEEATIKLVKAGTPSSSAKRTFKAKPLVEYSSLAKLWYEPVSGRIVVPKQYFRASNELVVLTLIVCWTITLLYSPDKALNHPARNHVGHFNPCFGWDFAPASYLAVFACAADVYLAWTYASLESIRTRLRDYDRRMSPAERFALVTAYLHGIASMDWMVLWLVGPPDGRWATHLAIFTTAVSFRYLCTLGNYVEQRFGLAFAAGRVHRKHTVFICVYGAVTASLPVLYFYDVFVYELEGRTGLDPPLPWWLLQAADVAWMTCLALSTRMAVPEPPMLVTWKVLEFDDEFELDDAEHAALVRKGHNEVVVAD